MDQTIKAQPKPAGTSGISTERWFVVLVRFAMKFKLGSIPKNATIEERIRVVILWLCHERFLPIRVSPDIAKYGCCVKCVRSVVSKERALVKVVLGYLNNTQSLQDLLTVVDARFPFVDTIRKIKKHYKEARKNGSKTT